MDTTIPLYSNLSVSSIDAVVLYVLMEIALSRGKPGPWIITYAEISKTMKSLYETSVSPRFLKGILKGLERDGFISRKEQPPKTNYYEFSGEYLPSQAWKEASYVGGPWLERQERAEKDRKFREIVSRKIQ